MSTIKPKEYIKKKLENSKDDLSLEEFDNLAEKISGKLKDDEFDTKKVKKEMAKYSSIQNGKIIFDTKEKSGAEYKKLVEKLKQKQESSFFNFNLKKDSKDSYVGHLEKLENKPVLKSFTKNKSINDKNSNDTKDVKESKSFNWLSAALTRDDPSEKKEVNRQLRGVLDALGEDILNDIYIYGPDYHYVPKIKLEPIGTQWIHDQQKDDKMNAEILRKQEIVSALMKLEFPAQKSLAWHALRLGRVTASDGGCVLYDNHYEPPHKFLYKKVMSPPFQSNINCYNGNKFEQTATMIYSYRMNVDVEEFGLIAHPTCTFLAASPDGIISQYKHDKQHLTKFCGRMLEIKCPTTRKINTSGEIKGHICPTYYWDQVQLQLECCNLDECDFWQCKISEYESKQDFLADTDPNEPFRSQSTGFEKGVIVQLMPKRLPERESQIKQQLIKISKAIQKETDPVKLNSLLDEEMKVLFKDEVLKCEHSKTHYCNGWKKTDPENCEYCEAVYAHSKHLYPTKINMTPYECDEWIENVMTNFDEQKLLDPALKVQDYYVDKIVYWKLDMSHCTLIERDKKWYAEAVPKIGKVWSFVEYFRKNMDKAKLFFEYVDSLTLKDNFMKDKDMEMTDEEIHNIMDLAEFICNEPSGKSSKSEIKEYNKRLTDLPKEIIVNNGKKEEKIKERDRLKKLAWKNKQNGIGSSAH